MRSVSLKRLLEIAFGRHSPAQSEEGASQRDTIWSFDPAEYETICAYLRLVPGSTGLKKKADLYLMGAKRKAPYPSGFGKFIAERKTGRIEIGWLDVWTRLFFPRNPWRYKLNAVIALHECDPQGYEDLHRTPKSLPRAWMALLRIGFIYPFVLGSAALWIGALYLNYLARRKRVRGLNAGGHFRGRRILITGATRGLGADLTRRFLQEGADVVGLGRSQTSLQALKEEALQKGWTAHLTLLEVDVSRAGAVSSAIACPGIAEGIDVAIINAGVKIRADSLIDSEAVRRTFETNVFGALETVSAVLPGMVQRQCGHIVFVSSLGRWHGMVSAQGYNASKAALSNLADSLRIDLRSRDVRGIIVTTIEPGLLRTAMNGSCGLSKWLSVDCETAARKIVRGIRRHRTRIVFPKYMEILTYILALLPHRIRSFALSGTAGFRIKR